MSWAAQEWVWKHSKVLGIPRFIFLAIARRVFKDKAETGPTPLQHIVEITGMSESTVTRSIKELEKSGDLRVVKTKRGSVHRYTLGMQGRLIDVNDPTDFHPSERPQSHQSQRPQSPVSVTTDSPPLSPVTETTGTRQPDDGQPSGSGLSPVSGTAAYVHLSSNERSESTRTTGSTTAAAPRHQEKAKAPNGDNYRVIEVIAIDLLKEQPFESEADLIAAVKCACALHIVDYGRHPDVDPDVVHRACASAIFKHRNPEIVRRAGAGS